MWQKPLIASPHIHSQLPGEEADEKDDESTSFEDLFEMRVLRQPQHREEEPLLTTKRESDAVAAQTDRLRQTNSKKDDDPVLKVIDKIEDELDQPYEDLVPLEVKLALEDKVFGWSHLTSDILGHVGFTLVAYALVYGVLTSLQRHHPIPDGLFRLIRFVLSCWAGLSAFRMVRRRKRVWLRAAYGSKAYAKDATRRKKEIRESDRTTILGRIRRRRKAMAERGHQRKLRRAVERFENRHQRHRSMLQQQESFLTASPTSVCLLSEREKTDATNISDSTTERDTSLTPTRRKRRRRRSFHAFSIEETKSIGHDEFLFPSGPIHTVPYAHGGFFGAAPFMLANPHWIDVLRLLMPDVYIEISRRVLHAPASKLIHWAENNPVVAAFGTAHELENHGLVPNLEWDVFLDPHLVHRVELVMDEEEKFLRSCVPEDMQNLPAKQLRDEVLKSLDTIGLTSSQLSIFSFYEKELRERTSFLVDHMLIAHGNLTQLIFEQSGYAKKYIFSRVKRTRRTLGGGMYARQWLAVYAEALKLGMCLENYAGSSRGEGDESVEAESFGSATPTLSPTSSQDEDEDMAPFPRCNCLQCSASVLTREQSIDDLLDSSKRDLQNSECQFRHRRPTLRRSQTEGSPLRERASSADVVSSSRGLYTSMADSIESLRAITRCDSPFGLILDVKSRHVSKRTWGLIVDTLRDAGCRVEAIASFTVDEIRDISYYTASPVKEMIFFHTAGDLQAACHSGLIKQGDAVLFNAGSLLWEADCPSGQGLSLLQSIQPMFTPFDPEQVKRNYRILPFAEVSSPESDVDSSDCETPENLITASTLQEYKRKFDLSIGLYCQEFSIDDAAVDLIVKYVNENSHIYDLGLCWGGLNGLALRSIQPGRFTSTDGLWNQRYAGISWDQTLTPTTIEQ